MGNLASVCKAIERVGGSAFPSGEAADLSSADILVLPGVGNFHRGMENMERAGLVGFVRDWISQDKALIGICLGMQLLFESSEEATMPGLGALSGRVIKISGDQKVPHMGWNTIEASGGFFDDWSGASFYFVHSYVCAPSEEIDLATTSYGSDFVSAVATGRILAFQFHPEKSSSVGLELLEAALQEVG